MTEFIKSMPQTKQLNLIKDDPWLAPYEQDVLERLNRYKDKKQYLIEKFGSIEQFANAYKQFGIHLDSKSKTWTYREWAPAAHSLSIIGDFNNWDRNAHLLKKDEHGVWEITLSEAELKHTDIFKVHVKGNYGEIDRIPAYINRTVQNPETHVFDAQVWAPENDFNWTDHEFNLAKTKAPLIYECHPGLAQNKEDVGTFKEFRENVLPRIKDLGYNVIQMMAIQEHPYYGSFGYHVSSFFATSSRFGTPEELKELINAAHNMGIAVIMDIVHSHAVKNIAEGLNYWDGSEDHYFHPGGRGEHPNWDSKIFNYGKEEVLQFLLSNVKYWIEEFHFDGYRFDGVTSMLYHHHGNMIDFDHYDKYFKDGVEWDAITYLQLANDLIHELKPNALSIAEDMSGMPGLCRRIPEGGLGFDYRLGMGIPDNWIKLLKHTPDEQWDINAIWEFLTNRRWKEKTIAYCESHDQALVGDKSIAFWLMDKEMYWHMEKSDSNLVIDRGIAMHKIIRFLTLTLGGEGYLNFIGNEFGHPEWLDFPREGNDWSYKHCKRQWNLVDNKELKYEYMNEWDKAMINFMRDRDLLNTLPANQINMDTHNQVFIFERNHLIFVINISPTNSIFDYKFPVHRQGNYKIILNSDAPQFGGFERVDDKMLYPSQKEKLIENLSIYLPNRCALVFERVED